MLYTLYYTPYYIHYKASTLKKKLTAAKVIEIFRSNVHLYRLSLSEG